MDTVYTVKTFPKQLSVSRTENGSMVLRNNFVGNTNDFLCITNNLRVAYQQTLTKKTLVMIVSYQKTVRNTKKIVRNTNKNCFQLQTIASYGFKCVEYREAQ